MNRKLINKLIEWKNSQNPAPLLLTGARGVGKTYLLLEFAKTFYEKYIYINFERETYWYDCLIQRGEIPDEGFLLEYFHLTSLENSTLFIFDEIGACADLEKTLRFLVKLQEICSVAAVSSQRVPSDQFTHLKLYPIDFEEFLIATGNAWYAEVIEAHFLSNKEIPEIVHKELLAFFEDYLRIGGMPSAVNEYINTGSKYNISEKHRILMDSYLSCVRQQNPEGEALKISQILAVMDQQFTKENHKFQYSLIRKGASQAVYSEAMQFIRDTYYSLPCYKAEEELKKAPQERLRGLKTEDNPGNFKLYFLDVGILYSLFKTQEAEITEIMRKSLLENYIAAAFAAKGYSLYFWESSSQAKIEFLIPKEGILLPVEVRTGDNTRSKNISVFRKNCGLAGDSIKISTKNFAYGNNIKYVPVYAVFCI